MKTHSALLAAIILLCAPGIAEASNRSVASKRMTAKLFAEYNGGPSPKVRWGQVTEGQEVEGPNGPEWRNKKYQLEMDFPQGDGSSEWQPVELRVSCRHNGCTGQIWYELNYILEDHAMFRGRKGTYHETGWKEP